MNIIFDLDGTLGDTLPLCISAFKEAIQPYSDKILTDQDIINTFGPSEEGTVLALAPSHYDVAIEKYLSLYEANHHRCPSPFPGIRSLLDTLKREKIYTAMVTGKGEKSTKITLDVFGLNEYFSIVKTGSIEGPVKPQRIEEVILESGIDRANTYYVGDTASDVIAARQCGLKTISVAWDSSADYQALESVKPDYLFNSVSDLQGFVEQQVLTT
ncbi:HAD family hydrolase [Vibrio sp. WXL103]|uniref:HAD family hydrolase n=1 Tax=Vibrio sp. WXL103 TaxID=3450710 RepID=UPI003EC6BFC6